MYHGIFQGYENLAFRSNALHLRETTQLPATHGLPESSSPTWERKLGSVPNADLIVNSPPFPPLLPPPNSGPLDLGSPLSSISFLQCL